MHWGDVESCIRPFGELTYSTAALCGVRSTWKYQYEGQYLSIAARDLRQKLTRCLGGEIHVSDGDKEKPSAKYLGSSSLLASRCSIPKCIEDLFQTRIHVRGAADASERQIKASFGKLVFHLGVSLK